MEAPDLLNTVEPLLPAASSRPGPVFEAGEGVFRAPVEGKYRQPMIPASPESSSISSVVEVSPVPRHPIYLRPESRRNLENLLLYYQNVGGMNSVVEDYRLATADHCYDIIALTETWLDSRTLSSQIFGSDYEVFRCDRNQYNSRKSTGGGVAIAVSSKLKARIIENDMWNCVEQIWVAITLGDRTVFVCVVYFPPDRTRDCALLGTHTESVAQVMANMSPVDEVVVLGDFNLPEISWKPSHSGFMYPDPQLSAFHAGAEHLIDNYSTATLLQINNVVNENGRSLDLCFVSAQDVAPTASVAPAPLVKIAPHHPPLVISLEHRRLCTIEIPSVPVYYDYLNADHHSIAAFLSEVNWDNVLDRDNVEEAAQTFSHVMAYVIDRYVPKRANRTGRQPLWQSAEWLRIKTAKRAALRKYTKHRTLTLRNHYVRLNIEFKKTSKRCYSLYQRRIQRKLKTQPKSFWKYVNEQRKETGLPSSMVLSGETATEMNDICRLFSAKFASVFTAEELSSNHISNAANKVPLHGHTFGAIEVDNASIISAARRLKLAYSPGPDGIPSVLLKSHLECLLAPLRHLFQLSLSSGIFPSCWKHAHMFPVYKKGNRHNVDNYRGITSLSAVSKLFELVVMEPLLFHCKQYLSNDQHGFITGRSTTTNLICLTSHITTSLAERNQTDVIYTDLSAAFDKINHAITIAKMQRLGLNGPLLRWFNSYLSNRWVNVTIGDCQSNAFKATSGIPQGSHLGPLLFLLYFNDVNLVLDGPRLSFADDLKMFHRIRSVDDAHFLQDQLNRLAGWCKLNRMVVNPCKCSVITFARKRHPIFFHYHLSEIGIERVEHVKDLGVILDTQLTFKQHVSFIVDKASRTLGFIMRMAKNFSDVYCLKSLYCSLVRPILEFNSAVWNPVYLNGAERIESVQRRFVRFALRRLSWRDPYRLPSYESRCQLIDLETLKTRRDVSRALFVADILQNKIDCPAILQSIAINVRPRALRNNYMLRLPLRRTNYGMHTAVDGIQRTFNRVASVFDYHLPRVTLRRRFTDFFRRAANG